MIYTNPQKIIGDAPQNLFIADVHQLYNDTCAIKSQQLILQDFGINLTEDQLRDEAAMYGWYNGGGTSTQDVGKLLELHGVPVTQYENANIFNLVNELSQGHKVIVGVDSGELWHDNIADMIFEDNIADHALIVSGIDTSDPNNVKVILTDPGTGDFLKEYPMDEFVDAWQDSNCVMVSTNIAVPEIFDPFGMPGGMPVANIPYIGQMPYDIFSDFAYLNYTNSIPDYVFSDFSNYVGGDISMLSPDTLDFFDMMML